ncbi:DUF3307 domain-containing protein [Pedobacter heparinus]|uniref:DUF3307 domain-containing protein n=1 Tax=Pedobacter heparinus TaxID=984 RepID=UPI00292FBAF3|nr:DUF3307 domain-containing protein [Pedobacter heparinus]
MELNLLLRLFTAHLLTDFVLQPKSWVKDREEKQGKSFKLYLHVTITTLFAYTFSGQYDNWVIPMVIFISHLAIDYLKSKVNKDNFNYFIADQIAHLLVIVSLSMSFDRDWMAIHTYANATFGNHKFWILTAGYLFVSWPLGIIIGKATQKWRDQITRETILRSESHQPAPDTSEPSENTTPDITPPPVAEVIKNSEEQELGLASAGKWIGICERILILTFVLMGQYTAIGFLMTAKSILRFSEKEANTQLKTEYVLVGTLVSFATSAMIGVLINLALK